MPTSLPLPKQHPYTGPLRWDQIHNLYFERLQFVELEE